MMRTWQRAGRRLLDGGALLLAVALLQTGANCAGGSGAAPTPSPSLMDARSCANLPVSRDGDDVDLEMVLDGLHKPLLVVAPRGDLHRIFVVEQNGRILIARDGVLLETPFLEIPGRVRSGGERGLLGLAFHPDYASNGRFFVDYTNPEGDTHVAEYVVSSDDPDRADRSSEFVRLVVEQPFSNHNGGHIVFGDDGYLYVGLGDGGAGGDPRGHGQNLGTLLGTILRIDVNTERGYSIPTDNPFVDVPGARQEIWSYGLRNPWRFSFDSATGDLWIGDVGQNRQEEISVGLASGHGGENFGWKVFEADECFGDDADCTALPDAVPPVVSYDRDDGCSVTGGVVYRGRQMPALVGTYFYADFCTGMVRSFRPNAEGRPSETRDLSRRFRNAGLNRPSSFGEDGCGETYITDLDGRIFRIAPR